MTLTAPERVAYSTQQAKVDLAAAHRLVVRQGLKDLTLGNHFTLVDPENPQRLLSTPEYESWPLVKASNLTAIDSEEQAAADLRLWINYRIHWPVHQSRADAACVMHLHPPYISALSMLDEELGLANQGALFLRDKISYTNEYDGAVGHLGMQQGEKLADALGRDKIAVVMRNHGLLTIGRSVAQAYAYMIAIERQAQYRILALSTGRKILEVPEEFWPDREKFNKPPKSNGGPDQFQANFEAQKRVLDRDEPDYRD